MSAMLLSEHQFKAQLTNWVGGDILEGMGVAARMLYNTGWN